MAASLDAWLAEQRGRAARRRPGQQRRRAVLVAALGSGLACAGVALAWSSSSAEAGPAPPPATATSLPPAPPASTEPALEPPAPSTELALTTGPSSPSASSDVTAPMSDPALARLAGLLDELRAARDLGPLLAALEALPASALATDRGRVWRAEALFVRTRSDQRYERVERALELLDGLDSTEARIVRADALGSLGRFEEAADVIASALDEQDPALRARALDMARSVGEATFPEGQRALFLHHPGGHTPARAAQAVRFFERLAAAAPPRSDVRVDALSRLVRARRVLEPGDRARVEATLEALVAESADVGVRVLRAEHALCWNDAKGAAAALRLDRRPPPETAPLVDALGFLVEAVEPRARGDSTGELAVLDRVPAMSGLGVWATSFRDHVEAARRMARESAGSPRELTAAERAELATRLDDLWPSAA